MEGWKEKGIDQKSMKIGKGTGGDRKERRNEVHDDDGNNDVYTASESEDWINSTRG